MTKHPETQQSHDRAPNTERSGEQNSTTRRLSAWLRRWDHANRNRRVYPTPWL